VTRRRSRRPPAPAATKAPAKKALAKKAPSPTHRSRRPSRPRTSPPPKPLRSPTRPSRPSDEARLRARQPRPARETSSPMASRQGQRRLMLFHARQPLLQPDQGRGVARHGGRCQAAGLSLPARSRPTTTRPARRRRADEEES
jgi:hypothetical protein